MDMYYIMYSSAVSSNVPHEFSGDRLRKKFIKISFIIIYAILNTFQSYPVAFLFLFSWSISLVLSIHVLTFIICFELFQQYNTHPQSTILG